MTDRQVMSMARLETFKVSEDHREKHRPLIWFAHTPSDKDWLWLEYQHFFLSGIYGETTGKKGASKQEIIALVVTADGAKWIESKCANPFWFWSVIHYACQYTETLPLSKKNLEDAAKVCLDEARDYMTSTHVSGWPQGYSGPQVPWHIWDLFNRGHIWNNRDSIETGLSRGLLMMQQAGRGAQVIYNPMLAELSMVPPDCTNSEEQQ